MNFKLKQPFLSIKEMGDFQLPEFVVLVGRNGVGKTQILDAIKNGSIKVFGLRKSGIQKFDINSFQPRDAGQASWGSSKFPQLTVDLYFTGVDGSAPIELARKIYDTIVEEFSLTSDAEKRNEFEEAAREIISKVPEFQIIEHVKGEDAASKYINLIRSAVIQTVNRNDGKSRRSSRNGQQTGFANNPAILVSLAMKLNVKLPHELSRDDILHAAYYEGEPIANHLSQVFTRYKVEQYSWAHTEGERSEKSFQSLMSEYREKNLPPWITLQNSLDRMRDASDDVELFDFDFTNPEDDRLSHLNHQNYQFEAKFINRSTGESYSLQSLSSGEKILVSLCLATFNKEMGQRQPGLILLDELDSVLHPAMISALISGLKEQFVENGTKVVMATHSITTVSLLEEGEIYKVGRRGNEVEIGAVSKSTAVSELSEGLATIDTGLRIAARDDALPVTILSEGHNALHLKKWAQLLFPSDVEVFVELPDKTGKDQLAVYGYLLDRMYANSHFLIVWDCDAESIANRFRKNLDDSSRVTAYCFTRRENKIAQKGIENRYDEKYLENYSNVTTDISTGKELCRSMSKQSKTGFAEHVYEQGSIDYFKHFEDLGRVVRDILNKVKED